MLNSKILIVDDDPDFCNVLLFHLEVIGYNHVMIAHNIEDGQSLAHQQKFDLAILDINLGKKESGIDLGIYLREKYPMLPIIFITNNYKEDIYEEAMPIRPSAFLNKEISSLKIRQVMNAALSTREVKKKHNPSPPLTDIFIKVGSYYKKIDLCEVECFFYEGRHANVTFGEITYPLNITMRDLAKFLPKDSFLRVHQSYIINIKKISRISLANGEIKLSELTIPIGIRFKRNISSQLPFLF